MFNLLFEKGTEMRWNLSSLHFPILNFNFLKLLVNNKKILNISVTNKY